jgi:hypothetical protein
LKIVVAPQRLVQRRKPPPRRAIRIGAALEKQLHAGAVVPVVLAEKQRRQAVGGQLSCIEQHRQDAVVVGFRRVVDDLAVVRIGAMLEEHASHAWMMRHSGRPVQSTLEFRRLVLA